MPWTLNAYVDRLWAATERLAGVSLELRPALRLVEDYGQHPNVLLYIAPPYLGSTRGWGNQFRHEMRGEAEHRELASALRGCAASVVLSGYRSALYDELYADWEHVETPSYTGQSGSNGRSDGLRTEVVWSNRQLGPDHLFSNESKS